MYQTGGGLVRVKEGGEVLDVIGFGANGIKNLALLYLEENPFDYPEDHAIDSTRASKALR
ncbi:hypothetical protein DVH05_013735 [Phytophthora capsici]|nr:hypothetical protein DVH05_013735 [Phytophthora capsici]